MMTRAQSYSVIQARSGLFRSTIFIVLFLLMSLRCLASLAPPQEQPELYVFKREDPFNISSKLGFKAPRCSRFCYPFNPNLFVNKTVPCAEHERDVDKWIPCLCTDRPFVRFLVDCVFRKCGPAIPTAFEFGYHICADYNISYPAPPEALKDLNITVPNEAMTIPETIPKLPFPFADQLPAPQNGASTSDEDPGYNLNVSLHSAAWGSMNVLGVNVQANKTQFRLSIALMILLHSMIIGLGGSFSGLF